MINALNDLNKSLHKLSKLAKGFAEITSIMVEARQGPSKKQQFYYAFNEFIWDINLRYGYQLKPFYPEEGMCEAMDNLNYTINFINERFNQKLYCLTLGASYNQAFDTLEAMKEVTK